MDKAVWIASVDRQSGQSSVDKAMWTGSVDRQCRQAALTGSVDTAVWTGSVDRQCGQGSVDKGVWTKQCGKEEGKQKVVVTVIVQSLRIHSGFD